MIERTNRSTEEKFYGCHNYPKCDTTEENDDYIEGHGATTYFEALR